MCNFVSSYKISAKFVNSRHNCGYFPKIQDGHRRHLVSANIIILATLSTTWCHSASAYQIWLESAHPRRRNGTDEIQCGGRRHLDLWSDGTFGHVTQSRVLHCTNIQNLNQIPQSRANLWLFFQNPRRRSPPLCFLMMILAMHSSTGCHSTPAYQILWKSPSPLRRIAMSPLTQGRIIVRLWSAIWISSRSQRHNVRTGTDKLAFWPATTFWRRTQATRWG